MQQLKKSVLGEELRILASDLLRAAYDSPAMSIASPIVVNCVDHLRALAINIDVNDQINN